MAEILIRLFNIEDATPKISSPDDREECCVPYTVSPLERYRCSFVTVARAQKSHPRVRYARKKNAQTKT